MLAAGAEGWIVLAGPCLVFFLMLLMTVPFAAYERRQQRRKRLGQCIRCGYDLQHRLDAECPECGWRRGTTGHDA
jgi:hypothetical protein